MILLQKKCDNCLKLVTNDKFVNDTNVIFPSIFSKKHFKTKSTRFRTYKSISYFVLKPLAY